MREFTILMRVLGVLLGLAAVGIVIMSVADGLPTTAIETWMVGELSLLLLGLLLLTPWRYVVRWTFWWIPFALLIPACLGAFALLVPSLVWAWLHGALGSAEIVFGALAVLICLGQFIAIWHLRRQIRQEGNIASG